MIQKNKAKKSKIIVSLALSIVLLFCFSINSMAVPNYDAAPCWDSIFSIELGMSFDGDEGNVSGTASKQSTASTIEGTIYLYKLVGNSWVYMDEWYKGHPRGTLAISGDFTCESGVTYKAEFVVTAYTNNIPETETVEYINTCP